ncbi:hypothetical protein JG688_00017165, partial [Phytophthora aleatoria]
SLHPRRFAGTSRRGTGPCCSPCSCTRNPVKTTRCSHLYCSYSMNEYVTASTINIY